jgi:signal transduction histidine kinase
MDEDLGTSRASILLVDDYPANLLALEALLGPLGHRIVKASSGDEALKCLLDEDFALILMDVMMPGMDGFQTVAMIKERRKTVSVPIIFVTAMAKEAQQISKGYAYGAVDYITKPFDSEILKAKVSVLVALHLQAERIIEQRALLLKQEHQLMLEQVERAAAQKENRAKDQFLAMVSHELRTPLNAILGWTQMLTNGRLDEQETRRAIETIRRNAEVQARLVEDLLDISRIVAGKAKLEIKEIGLAAVVASAVETIRPAADAKGLAVEVAPFAEDDRMRGDFQRLVQVLVNLLANAVKYTPDGGRVEVAGRRDGEELTLVVRDNGMGMAKSFIARAFEPFAQATDWSAQIGGLGLGLAISRHIVELHGGRIAIASEGEGKGAEVTVTLPVAGGGSLAGQ